MVYGAVTVSVAVVDELHLEFWVDWQVELNAALAQLGNVNLTITILQ